MSNDSINFLESHKILKKKNCWDIKQINLYKGECAESFLNFGSETKSFQMTSYNSFYKTLETKLKKNKLFKIKKKNKSRSFLELIKKNYEIIIIADINNSLFKKFFSKHIRKNYNSTAFTTIISHQKLNNNIAEQFFTKFGPLAFLPISKTQTSIVFSVFDKDLLKDKKRIIKLINFYNRFYDIKKLTNYKNFQLIYLCHEIIITKIFLLFGDHCTRFIL